MRISYHILVSGLFISCYVSDPFVRNFWNRHRVKRAECVGEEGDWSGQDAFGVRHGWPRGLGSVPVTAARPDLRRCSQLSVLRRRVRIRNSFITGLAVAAAARRRRCCCSDGVSPDDVTFDVRAPPALTIHRRDADLAHRLRFLYAPALTSIIHTHTATYDNSFYSHKRPTHVHPPAVYRNRLDNEHAHSVLPRAYGVYI